jgi:hypothetical protein
LIVVHKKEVLIYSEAKVMGGKTGRKDRKRVNEGIKK